MGIDVDKLMAVRIVTTNVYTARDVMLYALGLGLGADPLDPRQLGFVYERDLQVLPTFGGVMGYPGFWIRNSPELGITWQKLLNGEQSITLHAPLPQAGTVQGITTVERIVDKGAGKGALLYTRREVVDERDNLVCTVRNTAFLRADGGSGGSTGEAESLPVIPDREADLTVDWHSSARTALLYRLSGDYNPLHADPEIARQGGFERPILHGAASWGMTGYVLLQALCDSVPGRFLSYRARFTAPSYPGETQRTLIWKTAPGKAVFRVVVPQRDVTILNQGAFNYLS